MCRKLSSARAAHGKISNAFSSPRRNPPALVSLSLAVSLPSMTSPSNSVWSNSLTTFSPQLQRKQIRGIEQHLSKKRRALEGARRSRALKVKAIAAKASPSECDR